ncbi:unnamed protein product, partial [Gulo gulo]
MPSECENLWWARQWKLTDKEDKQQQHVPTLLLFTGCSQILNWEASDGDYHNVSGGQCDLRPWKA